MATVFLDSSAWFAAMSPRQTEHGACLSFYRSAIAQRSRLITTSMVIAEMHALLLRRSYGDIADRFLAVLDDPQCEVVVPDAALLRSARARWIAGFAGQGFSLCDAVSFEVMRSRRTRTAFTLDQHFAVAGFTIAP